MPDKKLTQLTFASTVDSGTMVYVVPTPGTTSNVAYLKTLESYLTGRNWASGKFNNISAITADRGIDLSTIGALKIIDDSSNSWVQCDSSNLILHYPAGPAAHRLWLNSSKSELYSQTWTTGFGIRLEDSNVKIKDYGYYPVIDRIDFDRNFLKINDESGNLKQQINFSGIKFYDSGSKERLVIGSNTQLRNNTGATMIDITRNSVSLSNGPASGIQTFTIKTDNANAGMYQHSGGITTSLGVPIKVHDGFSNNRILVNTLGTTLSDTNTAGTKINKFSTIPAVGTVSTGTFIYDASGNLRFGASDPNTIVYHYSQKPALFADVGTTKLVDFAGTNRVLANTTGVFLLDAAGRTRLQLDATNNIIIRGYLNQNVLKSDTTDVILYSPGGNEAIQITDTITTIRAGGQDVLSLDSSDVYTFYNLNSQPIFYGDSTETVLGDKDGNKRIGILTGNLTVYNKNGQVRLVSEHNNTVINSNLNVSGQILQSGRRPLFEGVTGISITGGKSITGFRMFTGFNISIVESGNIVYFNPATVTGVLTPWNSHVNAAGYSLTNGDTGFFNKVQLNSAGTAYQIYSDVDTFTIRRSDGVRDVLSSIKDGNLKIYGGFGELIIANTGTDVTSELTIGELTNHDLENRFSIMIGDGAAPIAYLTNATKTIRFGINNSDPQDILDVSGNIMAKSITVSGRRPLYFGLDSTATSKGYVHFPVQSIKLPNMSGANTARIDAGNLNWEVLFAHSGSSSQSGLYQFTCPENYNNAVTPKLYLNMIMKNPQTGTRALSMRASVYSANAFANANFNNAIFDIPNTGTIILANDLSINYPVQSIISLTYTSGMNTGSTVLLRLDRNIATFAVNTTGASGDCALIGAMMEYTTL